MSVCLLLKILSAIFVVFPSFRLASKGPRCGCTQMTCMVCSREVVAMFMVLNVQVSDFEYFHTDGMLVPFSSPCLLMALTASDLVLSAIAIADVAHAMS